MGARFARPAVLALPEPGGHRPVKSLVLVRHAHAADGRDDHERELTRRGRRAAVEAGKFLARVGCEPQLVLLSTAARVAQTWQHIREELSGTPRVEADRSLYLADVDSMHAQFASIPPEIESVLVVAHNPGITELADWLASSAPSETSDRMRRGFPPAAVASLALDLDEWSDIAAHCAEVRDFWNGRAPIESGEAGD